MMAYYITNQSTKYEPNKETSKILNFLKIYKTFCVERLIFYKIESQICLNIYFYVNPFQLCPSCMTSFINFNISQL